MSRRAPVLFLSHGAPPLADDALWTSELAGWAGGLDKPDSILMVSAHWEAAPITLSSTSGASLLYDFWGFPQKYYQVRYAAPPAPELAATTQRLLADAGSTHRSGRDPRAGPRRVRAFGRDVPRG